MEKISVIMAVYKENEEQLKQAIESILNQTYKNLEYIIIVDNPTEKWRIDYIKHFNDNRIKLIVNEKNMGLVYSLNKGLEIATGRYIARMDADDISYLNRLQIQKDYLEKYDIDLCGSDFIIFYEDKDIKNNKFPRDTKQIYKMLLIGNCIAHPTWFAKKEVFNKLNGYRNVFACEDYDFLLRARKQGYKLANIPKTLLKYRLSDNSISRSNAAKQRLIARYLREKNKKSIIPSICEIDQYINSKEFLNKTDNLNKYIILKQQTTKCKMIKKIKNYLKMTKYCNFFIQDVVDKIKYIFLFRLDDKKENN